MVGAQMTISKLKKNSAYSKSEFFNAGDLLPVD